MLQREHRLQPILLLLFHRLAPLACLILFLEVFSGVCLIDSVEQIDFFYSFVDGFVGGGFVEGLLFVLFLLEGGLVGKFYDLFLALFEVCIFR